MRTVLVMVAAALLVANVFALPRTLAALGVARGVDPASLMLGEGCGCSKSDTPAPMSDLPAAPTIVTTTNNMEAPNLYQPLAKTCIDISTECGRAQVEIQVKCNNESWWRCMFGPERYKRWKYDWPCTGGCHIVRCCPWTFVDCCDTQTGDVPCQGNDPPCAKTPCSEPAINCN